MAGMTGARSNVAPGLNYFQDVFNGLQTISLYYVLFLMNVRLPLASWLALAPLAEINVIN